jgi:alkanesulfonate monooxygenase
MKLRFHWSMSSAGENLRGAKSRAAQSGIPNLKAHIEFCQQAERCGMESLLTAFGFHRPDPITLATALGMATDRIKFMVAVRSGVFAPAVFVQQVNTVSALLNGRICLNVVAGHTPQEQASYGDFLSHDERYERTDEFMTVCRKFWGGGEPVQFHGKHYRVENGRLNTPFIAPDRSTPEIYLGGNSRLAEQLAIKHADCAWRLPDTPEKTAQAVRPIVEAGKEAGLLVSILARPTREEALRDSEALLNQFGVSSRQTHQQFARRSDSVAFKSTLEMAEKNDSPWLTPNLWIGAVPYLGAPSIAFVGSAEEVASTILEYKQAGITQFLFMGWPDLEEMIFFSREVLPLVRKKEDHEPTIAIPLETAAGR